jgi:hypothetical protein
MELDMKNNSKKWQDAEENEVHQLLEYHCKYVVIDLPVSELCYSLFGGENSRFHLSNGDPNVKQCIVTHNLRAWNARTMKEDLVHVETQFKHCLFLEDKDPVPEDRKRSMFKELVT